MYTRHVGRLYVGGDMLIAGVGPPFFMTSRIIASSTICMISTSGMIFAVSDWKGPASRRWWNIAALLMVFTSIHP